MAEQFVILPTVLPRPPSIGADEEGSGLRFFNLEDDLFTPQRQQPPAWISWNLFDEEVISFAPEDESAWIVRVVALPPISFSVGEDESGSGLSFFNLEDDLFTPQRALVIPWNAWVLFQDDDGIHLSNFWPEDESASIVFPMPLPWTVATFTDDDSTAFRVTTAVDDEPWFSRQMPLQWAAWFFFDEEVGAGLSDFWREDDLFTPAQPQPQPWNAYAFFPDDDFASTLFGKEDDPPAIVVPMSVVWVNATYAREDDGTHLSNFFLDDEFSSQAVQPIAWNAWVLFDEEVSGQFVLNLIPDFVFVEPTRRLLFSLIAAPFPPTYPSAIMPGVGQLGIDINGNGEQVVAAWDAKLLPEILAGGTLLLSPAPTIQQVPRTDGQPALTFSSIQINDTQIQAIVSVTGGEAGTKYSTLAKVFINNVSTWRYIYGDVVLIGPN